MSDLDLLVLARSGDTEAFGTLWERHKKPGLRAAAALTRDHDPEDMLQEAFLRILSALRGGSGPTDAFRPYLYAVLRSISMNWKTPIAPTSPLEALPEAQQPSFSFEGQVIDGSITARAFAALRREWQTVLWYLEVEGMTPREVAPLLGVTPNAVSTLAYRAREALRAAWLQAHLKEEVIEEDCRWSAGRLGRYRRKSLPPREHEKVDRHLAECLKCTALSYEIEMAASNLGQTLLPLFLGHAGLSLAGNGMASDQEAVHLSSELPSRTLFRVPRGKMGIATAALSTVTALLAAGMLIASWADNSPNNLQNAQAAQTPVDDLEKHAEAVDEGQVTAEVFASASANAPEEPTASVSPLPAPSSSANSSLQELAGPPTALPNFAADLQKFPLPSPAVTKKLSPIPTLTLIPNPTPSPTPISEELARPSIQSITPNGLLLPEVVGTGVPGAVVHVMGNNSAGAETVVDSAGRWAVVPEILPDSDGVGAYEAYQTLNGLTSLTSERISGIPLPTPEILSLTEKSGSWQVTFNGPAGSTIEAFLDGVPTGNQHQMAGTALVRDLPQLPAGIHVLTLRFTEPGTARHGATVGRSFVIP